MPRDYCDCGSCCEACGHTSDCIRWDLTGADDVAAQVAAEDYGTVPPRVRPLTVQRQSGGEAA